MVAVDFDVVDTEEFGGAGHGVVPVSDFVDKFEFECFLSGEDASVGEGAYFFFGYFAVFCDE